MNPLAFLPGWGTAAIIAALLVALGVEEMRISALKRDHAEYVADVELQARIASDAALAEQTRRQQAYDEEAEHARAQIKEMEAAVVQLAADGDGLRDDLSAALKRASQNSKPAGGSAGKSGQDAGGLLSQLYLGSVRTNQELAEAADRVRTAGLACERAADKVRATAAPSSSPSH